jgi:hypothetical protein
LKTPCCGEQKLRRAIIKQARIPEVAFKMNPPPRSRSRFCLDFEDEQAAEQASNSLDFAPKSRKKLRCEFPR